MGESEVSIETIYKYKMAAVISSPDYFAKCRAFDVFVDTFFAKVREKYGEIPRFLNYDITILMNESATVMLSAKVYGAILGMASRNRSSSFSQDAAEQTDGRYFSESTSSIAANGILLELVTSIGKASFEQSKSERPLGKCLDRLAEIFIVNGCYPSEKDRKTVKECVYQAFLAAKKEYVRMSSSMRTLLGMLFLLVGIPLAIAYFVAKYLRLKASP